jgi:hypothetical protein
MRNGNIDGYDIMNRPMPSENAFLATEKLFHGISQNKKKTLIKNQQMYDYHMYRNALPWEMNPHAENMYGGYNRKNEENPYTKDEYRQQENLNPTYYDTVNSNFGEYAQESRLPIPLDNDLLYQYNTNMSGQGMPHMIAPIAQESRNDFKQRRSDRSYDQITQENRMMQDHIFTPMNGYGQKTTNGDTGSIF